MLCGRDVCARVAMLATLDADEIISYWLAAASGCCFWLASCLCWMFVATGSD
jgi:hypothetical protein